MAHHRRMWGISIGVLVMLLFVQSGGATAAGSAAAPTHALDALDPAPAQVPAVALPGPLSLFSVGLYQVGYRQDGRPVRWLGLGWSGEDIPTGAVYAPGGEELGRSTAFIHVPWRGRPGDLFIDYRLTLPPAPAFRLVLGVALRPGAVGSSDGVTLRVFVNGREALSLNNATATWRDGSVDLADYAGQTAHLRLQMSPGPARNTGWDWSLLAEPRLVPVGGADASEMAPSEGAASPAISGGEAGPGLSERLADMRRRFGTVDAGEVLNRPAEGVRPTTADKYQNAVDAVDGGFRLRYAGEHGALTYDVTPTDRWPAAVNWEYTDRTGAVVGGGPALVGAELVLPDGTVASTRLIGTQRISDGISLRHEVATENGPVVIETRIVIAGKSLGVAVRQEAGPGVLASVRFGDVPLAIRQTVPTPYLTFGAVRLDVQSGLFVGMLTDWTASGASQLASTAAAYQPLTDGRRHPIREQFWLTISPHLAEVLPNIPNEPSPMRADLARRVVADVWGGGTFAQNRQRVELLAGYGVRDLAIIYHVWQHQGYDNAYPDVLPANPDLGGDGELAALVDAARQAGYRFALHENYIDFYPNAASFTPEDIALEPSGERQTAWFNESTGIQSFALKPAARVKYAEAFSPRIHAQYRTNAAFLDVHSATPPWFHVDFDAAAPGAGRLSEVWDQTRRLFRFVRETHAGPLFGEGNNHFFWAGAIDGVEAQVAGGEHAPWWVDFDLLKIHPQMVNHGLGYLERWWEEGYDRSDWYRRVPTQEEIDQYRAMELAFGHAGFIPNQIWQVTELVPTLALQEIFLMAAVQSRYGASVPTAIRYVVSEDPASGEPLPEPMALSASEAMRLDVAPRRLYVQYASGLELWVNGDQSDWRVEDAVLPPFGFLARAAGMRAATQRAPSGVIYDVVTSEDYVYANGRGSGYVWPGEPAYRERLNLAREAVDMGVAVTDGSFVMRPGAHERELRLWPIPRRRVSTIGLRLATVWGALGGSAAAAPPGPADRPPGRGDVTVVAVVDGEEVPIPSAWDEGRLTFTVGEVEADHYVIRW